MNATARRQPVLADPADRVHQPGCVGEYAGRCRSIGLDTCISWYMLLRAACRLNIKLGSKMQPRETPMGFLLDSREFLVAAELLLNRTTRVSLPAYFLLARSIELSLKAFLLTCGMTSKRLGSRDFGHDLVALLAEAIKQNLHNHVPLNPTESGVVQLLSYDYLGTRLGYRVSGRTYHLPLIDVTEQVARKLLVGLEAFYAPSDQSTQRQREAS